MALKVTVKNTQLEDEINDKMKDFGFQITMSDDEKNKEEDE